MKDELYLESLIPEDLTDQENPRSFEVDTMPSTVGRAEDCDYRIVNPLVSRRHCYFYKMGDEVWVRDLGSRNGTHVNGERVFSAKPIHDGDRLDIGYLPYRVRLPAPSRLGRLLQKVAGPI